MNSPNLISAYVAENLDFVDVVEGREHAIAPLIRRIDAAHRYVADQLAVEISRLTPDEAADSASSWKNRSEQMLVKWGLDWDTAHACASGVAGQVLRIYYRNQK
ncbi:MAG: hypothetical protein QM651_04640 [Rhodoblastus sp.]